MGRGIAIIALCNFQATPVKQKPRLASLSEEDRLCLLEAVSAVRDLTAD
jgi:hypothetical protein